MAAAVTWPLAAQIATAVNDFGDPLLNAWALAWIVHALPASPAHLFDANIFFPERGALAFSETLLLPALLVTPAAWAGAGAVTLHNLTLLSALVLSGVTMFALARRVTGDWRAALVAAVAFTAYPYRAEHMAKVQLQLTYLLPLALLEAHRISAGEGKWRHAIVLGLALGGQFLSCVYYAIYFATVLPLFVVVAIAVRRGVSRRALAQLAAAAMIGAAMTVVVLPAYLQNRSIVGDRQQEELIRGSAEWRDYRRAHPENLLYGNAEHPGPGERRLFPGFTTPGLAAAGTLLSPVAAAAFATAAVFSVDASLGVHGLSYEPLYRHVVAYRALRVPARFGMLTGLFLSVLAGLGTAALLKRIRSARVAAVATGILSLIVVAESLNRPVGFSHVPRRAPAVYEWLRHQPDGPILEYPIDGLEGRIGPQDPTYMYFSTFHWRPLLNGYSGFYPPSYVELLSRMKEFPSSDSIAYLRGRRVRYLLLHSRYYLRGGFEEDVAALSGMAGVRLVAGFQDRELGATRVFELARSQP